MIQEKSAHLNILKLKIMYRKYLLYLFLLVLLNSCVAVKSYEKQYLSDPDMKLTANKIEKFENNAQVYREAASGANGGKTGGGCGCN